MTGPITPLHVRSGYSLLRGVCPPQRLARLAADAGHRTLALTDVNNLCAAPIFHPAAEEAGVRPLLGAELSESGLSVVALIADETGYSNLCRLITRIHCRGEGGANLPTDAAGLSDGLQFIAHDAETGEKLLAAGVGADRLWLGLDPRTQSRRHIYRLLQLSGRASLPPVASPAVLLANATDAETAKLLTAIRTGTTLESVRPEDVPNARAVLPSPAELRLLFADLPAAVANNRRLVERCRGFRLLPRQATFPGFPCDGGPVRHLRRLCRRGLKDRYGPTPGREPRRRLRRELRLIGQMGFVEYFLVVHDIVRYARGMGAPVAGRGSGAGSIVAYVLGITNVCPLRYDIPFERFLHEDRDDFPDLDVDFCWRVRDEIIDYAFRRWGHDNVAMVSTHNTFQPASAARETAKALGYSDVQVSRLAERNFATADDAGRIFALAERITHLPHLLSVHPGGIVITPGAIDRHVPVQPSAKGVRITQYDKDGVEAMRLVKLDLLGNRNLSTVRAACDEIRSRGGPEIDVESLPPDDAATLATLRTADTVGCNQLESPAMRSLLKMMQPRNIHDVMQVLALIRPGAAGIGMKDAFIRRRRGLEETPGYYPPVDALLAETFGIMLYEDDVMLTAAAMLDLPPGKADRFRKAVQKCRTDAERLSLSEEFLSRATRCGVDADSARELWLQMAKFNSYSFCRAHAASYGCLAYTGAYLKTHYPLEFWTAALNNNQSMYPTRAYAEQAKREGVRFLLPDVNRSREQFAIDEDAIRVGLASVAGLGPAGVEEILHRRQRRPFESLGDFLRRVRLAAEQIRSLILCGAFDFTGRSRPTLMMELNLFDKLHPDRDDAQLPLLSAGPTIPAVPGDYPPERKYADERRILGLCVREHIMEHYREQLDGLVDADSTTLAERVGRRVTVAGVLEAARTTTTRNGRSMAFLTLDDGRGLLEVSVPPDVRCNLNGYGPYLVTGKVEDHYGAVTISAGEVAPANVPPLMAAY
ncbi:MAG: DNA polymerase III subunit alpha [Phycisphaerae bacterium]